MPRLRERQKAKHRATRERRVSRFSVAIAADTMRVTARLMPEVDKVTASRNTERISW